MQRRMTRREECQAAEALAAWFQSQEIHSENAVPVMVTLIAAIIRVAPDKDEQRTASEIIRRMINQRNHV